MTHTIPKHNGYLRDPAGRIMPREQTRDPWDRNNGPGRLPSSNTGANTARPPSDQLKK